ncbi:MAG: hypothetical protein KGL90_15480 [Burkholderiales bacterium]|nr:hypothetical protein [Burkholderiales bacterium]
MSAYVYRMPAGIPGDITRPSNATVETQLFNSAAAFAGYGLFGKISSGKFVPVGAGDAATAVYGLLARPFPVTGANASDPLGTSVPPTTGAADVLRRGYAAVKVNAGSASVGGTVYIRVAAAAAGKPIGGIEAAADSINTIVVAGASFMSAADASGNAEIAFNI